MSLSSSTHSDAVSTPVTQPSRAFKTYVSGIEYLSPHFTRFTLKDEKLQHFYTGGLDQRIKLLLPREDGSLPELDLWREPQPSVMEWYTTWRELPDELRNPIRTYTVRDIRPQDHEIDVDFALHGAEGPASAWALQAQVGDELIVVGPDGRYDGDCGGIAFTPGSATEILLVGDETAAPAICAILEALPDHYRGDAFIEVPESADSLEITTNSAVRLTWLPRAGAEHGSLLSGAIEQWGRRRAKRREGGEGVLASLADASAALQEEADDYAEAETAPERLLWEQSEPQEGLEYAWLAGEAGVITSLRRHLVKDLGIDRGQVCFMGYWKLGRAGN